MKTSTVSTVIYWHSQENRSFCLENSVKEICKTSTVSTVSTVKTEKNNCKQLALGCLWDYFPKLRNKYNN